MMGSELTERVMAYLRAKLLFEAEFGDVDDGAEETAAEAQAILEALPSMSNDEAIAAMLDFLEQFEEL